MLTENQLSIISELVNKTCIIKYIEKTCLMWDEVFENRIISIKKYIWNLYNDALMDKVDYHQTVKLLSSILNKTVIYKNTYKDFNKGTCGHEMYKIMDSLFKQINKTFTDFFETL